MILSLNAAGRTADFAQITEWSGSTMGTSYSIKCWGQDDVDGLRQPVQDRLDDLNASLSTYLDNSYVSRFNRSQSTDWFDVNDDVSAIVQQSLEISALSAGAFDVTVGPLIRLWKFGAFSTPSSSQTPDTRLPSQEEVDAARNIVGFRHLDVQLEPPAIRKSIPSLEIDLSAIAKGYAVDAVGDILSNAGVENWMVEIGGEVRVRGTRPDKETWKIGIEAPRAGQRSVQRVVAPINSAIASSGDYRSYFEVDGKRYSHTIDPRTGWPVNHKLAGATVSASECATADAVATALMVLGEQAGLEWANEHGIEALLLTRSERGIAEVRSDAFAIDLPETIATSELTTTSDMPAWARIAIGSLVVFGIAMIGMAVGVILSNRRIKGSCGGLAGMKDSQGRSICDACTNPSPDCLGPDQQPS